MKGHLDGVSLGGLISMYAAFKYEDVFGRIGSISGSYWYTGMMDYMRSASSATGVAETHRFYVSVGIREALLSQGLDEKDVLLVLDQDAVHQVDFFQRQFHEAIKWLFR
jgi:predicted alpha/beta superfamily hydrolase